MVEVRKKKGGKKKKKRIKVGMKRKNNKRIKKVLKRGIDAVPFIFSVSRSAI